MSFKPWLAGFLAIMLAACSSPQDHADTLATKAGMQRQLLHTDTFILTSYSRIANPDQPLVLYIEGDGRAWKNKTTPSFNPTPRRAIGLELAALDASANVAYLARPCQFTRNDPRCQTTYWTDKRFSPEVVDAMNEAISELTKHTPGQLVHLVGYSGGAAIAVLVAAQRKNIASLRSIAGNLDTNYFTQHHHVSPLTSSLNPLHVAPQLSALPQQHFIGTNDEIIPETISKHFMDALGKAECATLIHVPSANHTDGWAEYWQQHSQETPVCR